MFGRVIERIGARRGVAGPYLKLGDLIQIIPEDYMVVLKNTSDEEIWRGISWVAQYECKLFNGIVVSFTTNYYNTEVMIVVAVP